MSSQGGEMCLESSLCHNEVRRDFAGVHVGQLDKLWAMRCVPQKVHHLCCVVASLTLGSDVRQLRFLGLASPSPTTMLMA